MKTITPTDSRFDDPAPKLTQNTAKYNECHAAAANNYLACAENDVNCRCTQLQVLADVCAPLCPQVSTSLSPICAAPLHNTVFVFVFVRNVFVHSNAY